MKRGERAACVHLLGLQLTGRIPPSQRAIYGLILQAQQNIVRLHPGDMGASLARVRGGRTTAGVGPYEHAIVRVGCNDKLAKRQNSGMLAMISVRCGSQH